MTPLATSPALLEEDVPPAPSRTPARVGTLALVAGLAGFALWATFAPLDEGVAAPASVSVDTKRKPVQHLSGGIVQEVLVREGETVREGQVLLRLDSAMAKANFESSRQRYFALRALEGRLLAEQAGAQRISWHADLQQAAQSPQVREQMTLQEQLLHTRRAALDADLSALRESERGQEGLIVAYRGMLENRRAQQALLEEDLQNTRKLVAEGFMPRPRQLELERQLAGLLADQAEVQGNMARARQAVLELRQRANSRTQEFRGEVETRRSDVTREVEAEAAKYLALREDLARTEIRSPATGQVVGLVMQTTGGVVSPGNRLMDIVPTDAPLLLEARLPAHVIDRVHAGLPVDIRFAAFAHTPTLVVAGEILSVSADLIVEPQTQVSYYLARVAVTEQGRRALGRRQMQAGMPAEVVIRTGERTVLTYLAGPMTRRMAAAMTEE